MHEVGGAVADAGNPQGDGQRFHPVDFVGQDAEKRCSQQRHALGHANQGAGFGQGRGAVHAHFDTAVIGAPQG